MTTTFDTVVGTGTFSKMSIDNTSIWVGLGVGLAIVIALYVLRSIGVFSLAKRQKLKIAPLAWVPLAWFFVLCKLVGKARFFNWKYEKIAIWLCLIFAVSELLTLVINVIIYLPLLQYSLLEGGIIYIGAEEQLVENYEQYGIISESVRIFVTKRILPFGLTTAQVNKIINVLQPASALFSLASTLVCVSVYLVFFRKYLPAHFMLASLLSIFVPITFAPFVFATRNKEPVDYAEYLRSRYQSYHGQYGNPFGTPYGQGGFNGQNASNGYGAQKQPDNPFSDFAEKGEVDPGDPFSEFDEKKNNDSNDELNNKN